MAEDNLFDLNFISFDIDGIVYAVDMMSIVQTIPAQRLSLIPDAPVYLMGLVDIRGVHTPIFDILNFDSAVRKDRSFSTGNVFFILDSSKGMFGLYASNVLNVLTVKSNHINNNPLVKTSRYVKGFVFDNNCNVSILDIEKIVELSGLQG